MSASPPGHDLIVREERDLDLPAALSILRPSFPSSLYVQLGQRTCSHWLNGFLQHESARLLVARRAGVMVGLTVFQRDTPAAHSAGTMSLLRRPGVLKEIASAALRRPAWLLRECRALIQRRRECWTAPEIAPPHEDPGFPQEGAYWVNIIAVAPHARRTGVASRLLRECLRLVADAGGASLSLYVNSKNTAGIQLYESLGFVRTPGPAESIHVCTRSLDH